MQEIRRFRPSTVSRRFSVAAGFYRTCVLDGVLEHSPAEHVRRPSVPAESPTLGFTHLQSGALLTAARESANRYDFALVAMLGLLGAADPRGHRRGHRRPRRRARPPGAAGMREGHQGGPGSAAACGRPGHRPGGRPPGSRADPAEYPRLPAGPARGHPPPAPSRRDRRHPDRQGTSAYAPSHWSRPCPALALTCATCRSLPATLIRAQR